jgi:predicted aspartyl protease
MNRGTVPINRLSRRHMIGTGAASLILAPALAQIPPANEAPAPLSAGASGLNLLTIGVHIDGKGPFQFVIDTGADRTVIADDVVRQLALRVGNQVMVEGVVRTVRADTVRVQKMAVGVVEREGLDTPVLPREQLQADGYLGLDVIDGYRVTLDFKNSELTLSEPRHRQLIGWAPPNEIPIRLAGSAGHLRSIECSIDGVRATAFVDSGAEISVGNSLLFNALVAQNPGYARQETIPLTGVTGGVVPGRVTTVKSVKLSGLTFEESRIAIADLQIFRLWEIDDRPALLIGMNWLRQFNKVSVDYARKELRFDLASRKREPPLRCAPPDVTNNNCRYLLGSPNTIPRPSVPT